MSSTDAVKEAQQKLGELFIVGFDGKTLPDDTSAFFSQAAIGGVIYFSHNYESPEQIWELSQEIQDCRGELPLWISVDQEGGRVQRFKEPFSIIPSGEIIGRADSPKLSFDLSEVIAKELKTVGINVNFIPVADILTNPKNQVIGDRAFGTHADQVSKQVTAMVRGHVTQNVQPCVKHFPGHGDTLLDSHEDLPVIETDIETLRDREFKPFVKTFKSRCNMVMVAHVKCTQLDPEKPATLSKKIVTDLLRNDMRCSKLIISDDMEMGALTKHFAPENAVVDAINAGCDLLIYRSEGAARKAYEAALRALDDRTLSAERVLDSANRSRALKKDTLMPFEVPSKNQISTVLGCDEHQEIINKMIELGSG